MLRTLCVADSWPAGTPKETDWPTQQMGGDHSPIHNSESVEDDEGQTGGHGKTIRFHVYTDPSMNVWNIRGVLTTVV